MGGSIRCEMNQKAMSLFFQRRYRNRLSAYAAMAPRITAMSEEKNAALKLFRKNSETFPIPLTPYPSPPPKISRKGCSVGWNWTHGMNVGTGKLTVCDDFMDVIVVQYSGNNVNAVQKIKMT